MISKLCSAAVTYAETAGSEINPLNMLLAVVYILLVMALIYVILLCIDKFARKGHKDRTAPEEKADEKNNTDEEKDE